MAWYAIDSDGSEYKYEFKPIRTTDVWLLDDNGNIENLTKGSIKKLTGKNLTWDDEPIEVK